MDTERTHYRAIFSSHKSYGLLTLSRLSENNFNIIFTQRCLFDKRDLIENEKQKLKWTVPPISEAALLLQTAEVSVVHTQPAIHLHLSVSISPTQCGFKGTGALKSAVGSSFSHDVSRRKSERERGGQYWGTEFIQYYWDIYSLADRYGEPPIPAPVSDAALRRTLIQLHWGAMRSLHPSFKNFLGSVHNLESVETSSHEINSV